MNDLNEKNLPILEKEQELSDKAHRLEKEWKDLAKKAKSDDDVATKPKFDESLEAHKIWKEFQFKNAKVLDFKPLD